MLVKRFADAAAYDPPNHWDARSLRLQGFEDGGPEQFTIGLSHYLPGGGCGPDSSPFEKVYVILSGELTLTVDGQETVLKKWDSCTIPAGEERKAENRSNEICTMMVAFPYPPGSR